MCVLHFLGRNSQLWLRPPVLSNLDHTQVDTQQQQQQQQSGRTHLNEWSARHKDRYLHNTQQTQHTNTHAVSEIRTRDPSNRTTADLRLRTHGHRDRPCHNYCAEFICSMKLWKMDIDFIALHCTRKNEANLLNKHVKESEIFFQFRLD